jgi:hypothetical protein
MDEQGLCRAIESFEGLIQSSQRLGRQDNVAKTLGLLFGMWCAFRVRMHLEFHDYAYEAAPVQLVELPDIDAAQRGAKLLLHAARSEERAEESKALAAMGISALCPVMSAQLTRMESVARSLSGRVQVILLVEVSLFAAEIGDHARAAELASEARTLGANAYELYNVCTVEGLAAESLGLSDEASKLLENAVSACQRDEYASLACAVRPLNLMLVEKLLDRGKVADVRKHLCACMDIWQSFRVQIGAWITLIDEGITPDFRSRTLEAMNEPGFRLLMQYASARFIDEESSQTDCGIKPTISPAEIALKREKLREEYRRYKNRQLGPDEK